MIKALVTAMLMAASNLAFAWEVINPDARGVVERMAGWYCLRHSDAKIIARRFKGEISAKDAAPAFERCMPEIQVVVGIFPERGITVVPVQILPDFRPSYFVPVMLDAPDQQEARGPPR